MKGPIFGSLRSPLKPQNSPPPVLVACPQQRWERTFNTEIKNFAPESCRKGITYRLFPQQLRHCNRPGLALIKASSRAEPEPEKSDEEAELLSEEDWVVPGGAQDSMSKNTKLGRALDDAVQELDTLGSLERETLVKANELLKKLGYKGDITAPQIPPKFNREELQQ